MKSPFSAFSLFKSLLCYILIYSQALITTKSSAYNVSHWTSSECKPAFWIEVGPPRTATTLQFQTLCLALFLRVRARCAPADLDHIQCKFIYKIGSSTFNVTHHPYAVVKTHELKSVTSLSIPVPCEIATTSMEWAKILGGAGQNVSIISEPSELHTNSELGVGIRPYVRRYAEMFELDAIDTEELISYLEYWDVLRMCCGVQMSRRWRQELERGTEMQFSAHQVCKKHIDIGVKERDFIKLPLTIQIAKIKILSVIARPSLVDGVLDGNYCERYRAFVKSGRSAFNRGIPNNFLTSFRPDKKNLEKNLELPKMVTSSACNIYTYKGVLGTIGLVLLLLQEVTLSV